jgi:Protein of unknown function (DUF3558)
LLTVSERQGWKAVVDQGPPQLPVVVALLALLLGGCAAAEPSPLVPPIENGRNALAADPCGLLADFQLAGLGLAEPGLAATAAEGPRCEWRGPAGTVLGLTLYTDGGGLDTLARNSEPTTRRVRVSGFPALETFTGRGEFCQYDVGIADTQAVLLSMEAATPDTCSTLQRVLPMVVANLPAAGQS